MHENDMHKMDKQLSLWLKQWRKPTNKLYNDHTNKLYKNHNHTISRNWEISYKECKTMLCMQCFGGVWPVRYPTPV